MSIRLYAYRSCVLLYIGEPAPETHKAFGLAMSNSLPCNSDEFLILFINSKHSHIEFGHSLHTNNTNTATIVMKLLPFAYSDKNEYKYRSRFTKPAL